MSTDLSLIELVTGASVLVQLVMLVLVLASFASWTQIFRKRFVIRRARKAADAFETEFWSGPDLVTLYKRINAPAHEPSGMERIFQSGFQEFAKLRNQVNVKGTPLVEATQRAMRVALNREQEELESSLSFLATVGSTSPYIGLFGTVWGIMNSFRALGNINQATLAHVAPGIAEALIATAMGLFAAIPAVIAYNRYATDVERLYNRYDNFIEEFAAILNRQSN